MATLVVTNLPPVPKGPMYTSGIMNTEWWKWFEQLRDRVGGADGSIIYDNAGAAQMTSSLEPQLFAIKADIQNELTGVLLSIIEQIQEQTFDPTALISDTQAGLTQQIIDLSPVSSVFGRTGAVVATEGDYSLTLLGDVTISAPSTDQVLKYNGTGWVNSTVPTPSLTTIAPKYETATATAGQTVFNTALTTTANSAGKSYLMVTCNGVVMDEGAGNDYTVTGTNQITFTSARALNDKITFRGWA